MIHLDLLAVAATAIFSATIIYDIVLINRRDVYPNLTTCFIFFFTTALNGISYFLITSDFARGLPPLAAIVLMAALYGTTVKQQRRFLSQSVDPLQKKVNYVVLILSVVVAALWIAVRFMDAWWANIMMQFVITVAYIPLVWGLVKGTGREKWWLWLPVAYAIQSYVAWMKYDGDFGPLVAPFRGTLFCAMVALLAFIYPNKHLVITRR